MSLNAYVNDVSNPSSVDYSAIQIIDLMDRPLLSFIPITKHGHFMAIFQFNPTHPVGSSIL